jgi:Ras-related protein Rab-11B
MGLKKRKKDKKRLKEDLSYVKKRPLIERKVKEKVHFDPHVLLKVLLIGHNDSGKITYLESFGNSWFEANTKLSIGISFEIKEIKIENLNIKLQIWDLVTEDRWRDLVPFYCRGALGAILMFEISNSDTLQKLSKWIPIVRDNTSDIPMILMGNNDVLNNPRQVSKEQALDYVRSEQLNGYFECNVITGENLNNTFESLTRMIIKKYENKN